MKISDKLVASLKKEIDGDYCLLGVPDYRNIGDQFIWKGETDFLESLSFKCKYFSSIYTFDRSKIYNYPIILLQGGGNFGDLWEDHQIFREKITSLFKEKKIIIFPQTIFFKDKKNMKRAAKVFYNHPNLVLCARDNRSYKLAKKFFKNNKILLVPDMAFFSKIKNGGLFKKVKFAKKTLILLRKDKESSGKFEGIEKLIDNPTTSDWPTHEDKPSYRLFEKLTLFFFRFGNKIEWIPFSNFYKKIINLFLLSKRNFLINKGVDFLSGFDIIITERLHGAIISLMLGKQVILLNNSYGKNKSFYETWLKKSGCYYASSKKHFQKIITKYFSSIQKDE